MPRTKTYALAVTLILLLGGITFALSDSSSELRSAPRLIPELGVVTLVEGDVEVKHIDGAWEPLYTGDRVRPDDAIRSGASGRGNWSGINLGDFCGSRMSPLLC